MAVESIGFPPKIEHVHGGSTIFSIFMDVDQFYSGGLFSVFKSGVYFFRSIHGAKFMRRTDSLFQLIKAMNRADKRNFKLLTQLTAGDKKYLKVFDAIDKQSEYDESRLLKQFEGDSLVNQFSVAKHYLYNSILRSLTYFYKGESSETTSLNLQARILVEKNLLPHARKILRKARLKAAAHEDFHGLMELLQTEREILLSLQNFKRFEAEIRLIQERELWVQEEMAHLLKYKHLSDKMFQVITANQSARTGRDIREAKEIMESSLIGADTSHLACRTQILQAEIRRDHAQFKGDYQLMCDFASEVAVLYDNQPGLKEAQLHMYIQALYGLSLAQYLIGNLSASQETLAKMKAIKTRSVKARIAIFEYYHLLALQYAQKTRNVGLGMQLLEDVVAQLAQFKGKLHKTSELLLYFYGAKMCLLARKYQEGLGWVQRLLEEPKTEVRTDLQCYCRLLELMLKYESGKFQEILQELKPTYRYIFKRDRMYKVERLALRSLRRLAENENGANTRSIFREMKETLTDLANNKFEIPALQQLGLDTWVNSKLEGFSLDHIRENSFG